MPELPEVETIKRDLEQKLKGLIINEVCVYDDRVLKNTNKSKFIKCLKGCQFKSIERKGKSLVIHFQNELKLFVQVKMTGYFVYGQESKEKETKIVFKLSNQQYLNYNDQRLFGWLIPFKDEGEIPFIKSLGPDPMNGSYTLEWLKQAVSSRSAPIKTLLMNQHFLAGVGNIYASEILFAARINPKKPAKRLTPKELKVLHGSTIKILNQAIKMRGTSMRNYRDASGSKGNFMNRIKVYGRENEPCFVCQAPVTRIVQSGRSTFFCNKCQTAGKIT